jgi:Fe-S-cluster-containing hydrogenase component 2
MKAIKVKPKMCVSCEICGIVCSSSHGGQIRESAMRIRIKDGYPDLPKIPFQPIVCRQCDDPECVKACPQEALVIDEKKEMVVLIESNCDGCGQCVEACPFDAIWIDPLTNFAIKCDLCGGDPQCVKFCNFDAIRFPREASK